jgi:hypothetical protein
MLLETAIEEAKHLKWNLTICWLDLANAIGSLPHHYLEELFVSLPIPIELQSILADIYHLEEKMKTYQKVREQHILVRGRPVRRLYRFQIRCATRRRPQLDHL